jgi:hypothetical protein
LQSEDSKQKLAPFPGREPAGLGAEDIVMPKAPTISEEERNELNCDLSNMANIAYAAINQTICE